jgi:hypothetical protein
MNQEQINRLVKIKEIVKEEGISEELVKDCDNDYDKLVELLLEHLAGKHKKSNS